MTNYKIAILSPFPPHVGGMVELANTLSDNFERDGHRVYRLQLGTGITGIFPFPYLYFRFLSLIPRCDIVQIISASGRSLWGKDLPAIILARIFGKKSILNFGGGSLSDTLKKWSWWKKLPFYLADSIVVPTSLFKEILEESGVNKSIYVIPHTVDIEPFQKKEVEILENDPVLFAAKAMESYSGFDLLLDIFDKVKKKISNARFVIAGSGPVEFDLKAKTEEMDLRDVNFLGNIPHSEMADLMSKSKVFIHGTRYEAFGIVLVEAMAAGLPVVAFNIGGIPEVVIDEVTGYLVDYADLDLFAEKIILLLSDSGKFIEISNQAIRHSKMFKWKIIKHQWYNVFDSEYPLRIRK